MLLTGHAVMSRKSLDLTCLSPKKTFCSEISLFDGCEIVAIFGSSGC